jgi:pyridinium-3,5-biscarboxylic acid mononucleotide sulfurtransferase
VIDLRPQLDRLEQVLRDAGELAVAVSGGVDSLTLATFAHRQLGAGVEMFHAVSPAVPADATRRVRALAQQEGWSLSVIDAGEFADADYRSNPVNRCFYCKTNLYGAVAPRTKAQIVSGTNLDDLGEYRPGLSAAKNYGVRHPFVEAGIDKKTVRAIARHVGLEDIAELPSAPCLSSRIETGIAIDPAMLGLVHAAEQLVTQTLAPRTVRCRVRAKGVVIELDETHLAALDAARREQLTAEIGRLFKDGGFDYPVSLAPYRTGSAFLVRVQRDAA